MNASRTLGIHARRTLSCLRIAASFAKIYVYVQLFSCTTQSNAKSATVSLGKILHCVKEEKVSASLPCRATWRCPSPFLSLEEQSLFLNMKRPYNYYPIGISNVLSSTYFLPTFEKILKCHVHKYEHHATRGYRKLESVCIFLLCLGSKNKCMPNVSVLLTNYPPQWPSGFCVWLLVLRSQARFWPQHPYFIGGEIQKQSCILQCQCTLKNLGGLN